MKEIIDHLNENRQIELAKHILESRGYRVTKKLDETYEWYQNDDGLYLIKGYFDADGGGDLPAIEPDENRFIAYLSGSDYKGKSFSDLKSAKFYIEQHVSPASIARYATDDGPWNW